MSQAGSVIKQAFWFHRWLLVLSFSFAIAVIIVGVSKGAEISDFIPFIVFAPATSKYLIFVPLVFLLPLFFFSFRQSWQESAGKRDISFVARFFAKMDSGITGYLKSPGFWQGVAGVSVLMPLVFFFCLGKSMIPHLTSYTWDPLFAEMDRLVHFGRYPHEYIVPLAERFKLFNIFDAVYSLYFIALFIANAYCVFFDKNPVRRFRYLWTTLFCWILMGIFAALAFASVGPVFYHYFYDDPSPYQDFVNYLFLVSEESGSLTIILTEELYKWVTDESLLDLNAISAMPSLHVAICAVMTFYAWSISKTARYVALVFLIMTLISTVYLGLHYAIDGYFGILGAWVIWFFVKPFMLKIQPELNNADILQDAGYAASSDQVLAGPSSV